MSYQGKLYTRCRPDSLSAGKVEKQKMLDEFAASASDDGIQFGLEHISKNGLYKLSESEAI